MAPPQEMERLFLAAIARDPNDVAALDGIGMLAARTGRLDAALLALSRAAELAPHDAQIQVHLGHIYHDRCEWEAASLQYARALYLAPNDAAAHEGAAYTAMRMDEPLKAERHRARAFKDRVLTYSTVDLPAPTVLLVLSSRGGNVDTRPYLAAEPINVIKLIAEELDHIVALPEFDFVFNGIGDCDRHPDTPVSLRALSNYLATTDKPVLNRPELIARTSRAENARRFAMIPGVTMPRIITVQRASDCEQLTYLISRCMSFPLLLRAPGYQTGRHFLRVDAKEALPEAIAALPGDELLAIEYLDTSDAHGLFRKYRMMTVGGRLYPAHLAVSDSWKVHYKDALTQAHETYRAEERAFLADPEAVVGRRAMHALEAIAKTMGLDYAGIDFAIDKNGNLVCFEANATMVVALPGKGPHDAERRAAALHIHHATKRLLRL